MGSSRILIVGGTGQVGRYVTLASARLGHPTFVLVRDRSPSDPAKAALLESFKQAGITLVTAANHTISSFTTSLGALDDYPSVLAAVKEVDIVISVVGVAQLLDQLKLLDAIKEVGTIKRFVPSEFGNYTSNEIPPLQEMLAAKRQVRNAIEKAGIPYTYVISGAGASWYLVDLWQRKLRTIQDGPPRDKITIYGDGNAKAVIIDENDIGTYTILAADDARTENKTLCVRPEGVYKSQNELVALWEQKIGHSVEKTYIPESELLKIIEESPYPDNFFTALNYDYLVNGYRYELDPDTVEASELYPDVKYTTSSQYLDRFV